MADLLKEKGLLPKKGSSSPIWKFFGFQADPAKPSEILDEKKVVCALCSAKLMFHSSTSVMHKHLKALHPNESRSLKSQTAGGAEETPIASTSKPTQLRQQSILGHVRSETPYGAKSDRQKQLTRAVTNFIVSGLRPLNTVDDPSFKEMLQMFDSRYTLPSRKTFSSSVIPKMYDEVRSNTVLPSLTSAKYVALTTDMWTSRAHDQYIGVTAHFITAEWRMAHHTLENAELPPPHDNEHIAESLDTILQNWDLQPSKVSAIVTDNAANITKAVREVMALPNIPCFGHTLNLVVQAGLGTRGVHNTIARCSKLVEFVRRSAKAAYILTEEQTALNFPHHKLIQDVSTRWGSTHDMLKRILEQQQPICNLLLKSKRKELDLTDREVMIAEKMVKILEPMKNLTESLSGETYVTLSGLVPAIFYVEQVLSVASDEIPEIRGMKDAMAEKLGQYYTDISVRNSLLLATFLDGRYKRLSFLPPTERARVADVAAQHATALIEEQRNIVSGRTAGDSATSDPAQAADPAGDRPSEATPHRPSAPKKRKSLATLCSEAFGTADDDEQPVKSAEQEARSEVERYLAEAKLQAGDNPLDWWKVNFHRFPALSDMAMMYLCIPATSVPAERLFSVAGNIVTAKRSLLTPSNVNQLTFLHANLK